MYVLVKVSGEIFKMGRPQSDRYARLPEIAFPSQAPATRSERVNVMKVPTALESSLKVAINY